MTAPNVDAVHADPLPAPRPKDKGAKAAAERAMNAKGWGWSKGLDALVVDR